MLEEDNSLNEDEWTLMKKRFSNEGLEFESLEELERTLQVWRWLVDAETNWRASRHVTDKLRRQHDDDKNNIVEYNENVRIMCENRVKEMEKEITDLKADLEALLIGTDGVSRLLIQEGLNDLANGSLGEQIAYLLVERSQLLKNNTLEKEAPSKIQEECLKIIKRNNESDQNIKDMAKRTCILQETVKQLEENNKALTYKVSEANQMAEDYKSLLHNYDLQKSPSTVLPDEMKTATFQREFHSLPLTKSSELLERRSHNSQECASSRKTSLQCLDNHFSGQILSSKDTLVHISEIKNLKNELQKIRKENFKVNNKYEKMQKKFDSFQIEVDTQNELKSKEYKIVIMELNREIKRLNSCICIAKEENNGYKNLCEEMKSDLDYIRKERNELLERASQNEQTRKEKEEELAVITAKFDYVMKSVENKLSDVL